MSTTTSLFGIFELKLMKPRKHFYSHNWTRIILVVLIVWTLPVSAEPVVVVTQDGTPVDSLSREEVADLFLGKRNITVAGQELTPLDVNDDALREAFYQGIAGMSAMRVNAYWARLVFSAQGRPPRKLPLSEAKKLVRSQLGLVTYMPSDNSSGFKILFKVQ
jgi:hypothetical protein